MSTTKFISRLTDEEIAEALWDAVATEGDRPEDIKVERTERIGCPYMVDVTYETTLDGEDERTRLTDTYTVDDYDIEPFDWSGDTTPCVIRWRKSLFGCFGTEYANYYLFGKLEERLSVSDASDWIVEEW